MANTFSYKNLLVQADREAREDFDPRITLYRTRNLEDERNLQTYVSRNTQADFLVKDEHDNITDLVQSQPDMIDSKQIVIIDTAQRDWTIQPDVFSNVFSFINPTPGGPIQVPFYFNNQFIPFSSYDMPDPNSSYYIRNNVTYIPNNNARTVDPTTGGIITINQPFQNRGMLAQTWGWRLVLSGSTGAYKHFDETNPATFIQPNDRVIYYPTYDAKESRGQLIGTDAVPMNQTGLKDSFGTQLTLSNIKSIKVARATLPLRRFDSYDPVIFGDASINFAPGTALNTFHSEPYILMSINNLTGQYYGAAPVIHNSFTALVQQQRAALDSTNASYFAQFQDYYPWSDEAFTFSPPLSQMSNAVISLSNSFGQGYTHVDDLNITTMIFGEGNDPSGSSRLGLISFLVTRDKSNPTINISSTVNCNWFFASNDLRPGDQISFYSPTLSKIQTDPSCTPAISNLLNYMQTNGAIVTKVSLISNANIPVIDVAYTFEAVVNTRNVNETYALYNEALNPIITDPNIPRFLGVAGELSPFQGQKYISLCASNTVISPIIGTVTLSDVLSPSAYYPLPTMNRNCQCTFAFEIVTTQADTSTIKKIIPN